MTLSTPTSRHPQGFTMVEVMLASLILVVAFIGMIEAMTVSSAMMDTARRQTLATQIINHEIEKLRFLRWDDPASTNDIVGLVSAGPTAYPTPYTSPPDAQFTATIAASGATYSLTRTVTDVVAGRLREVTFTVTWVVKTSRHDASGAPLSFTYTRSNSAYFGKSGLNLADQRS